MIVLDTHIWIWTITADPQLTAAHRAAIQAEVAAGGELGVPAISCWEVALLVSGNRLRFQVPIRQWLTDALLPPVRLLELLPAIAADGSQLPGRFHRDPADRLIVATARHHDAPLMTVDGLILAYPHVRLVP